MAALTGVLPLIAEAHRETKAAQATLAGRWTDERSARFFGQRWEPIDRAFRQYHRELATAAEALDRLLRDCP